MKNNTSQFYFIRKYINILYKRNKLIKLFHIILSILHILLQLPINALFLIKLKFYRYTNKIDKPIIHYYAVCWNEEKILPFMLDYYDQFVDQFYIYDNYSTDNTKKILSERSKVEVIEFGTNNSFNDLHSGSAINLLPQKFSWNCITTALTNRSLFAF